MNAYKVSANKLWDILEAWDTYLRSNVHLIACGGTALTLQNVKSSTKDIDFMVPVDKEYTALIQTLRKLGYEQVTGYGWSRGDGFIFDLFQGNKIFTTELLESPLKMGNNIEIRCLKRIYIGVLNDQDLIISKIFRGTTVDFEDCLKLVRFRGEAFDIRGFEKRYRETAKFVNNEERVLGHLESFLGRLTRK